MKYCIALLLSLLCCTHALAAPKDHAIITGPATGTYIAIGEDIQAAAKKGDIALRVLPSDGSIDNIRQLHKGEASFGIVQSDVLGFLKRSNNKGTAKSVAKLRMVAPLYKEEVHVLARSSIKSFLDLKSKRVVVGEEGSGNMLTAVNLLALMNVRVKETLKLSPPEGVVAVLEGKADAVIFVGGKPVKLFKNIEALERPENLRFSTLVQSVHFLPLDAPAILKEYEPATITPIDYGFVTTPVSTVAVRSVLVSRDMSASKKDCALVRKLMAQLKQSLPSLRSTGHPKWRDVDFSGGKGLWKQDVCSK